MGNLLWDEKREEGDVKKVCHEKTRSRWEVAPVVSFPWGLVFKPTCGRGWFIGSWGHGGWKRSALKPEAKGQIMATALTQDYITRPGNPLSRFYHKILEGERITRDEAVEIY